MQSLHVRFIFQLSIPLQGDFRGGYSFNLASNGIGLTLKTQNSEDNWYYQIQLLACDTGVELDATKSLTWAKRNPYILQTKANTSVEGLVLRLKIKHGIFDFRKIKKRAIRFNVNCFHSGTFVGRGTSQIYQLLPKKRKADDSEINEEVPVPVDWSQGHEVHNYEVYHEHPVIESLPANFNYEQDQFHSSDEERPKKRQRVTLHEHVSSEDSSPHAINSTLVADSYEMEGDYESAEMTPYYVSHDTRALATNTHVMGYNEYSPRPYEMTPSAQEQYMVLYNGNAEVIGNFRALNFYKASDINLKEDIRLLVEDRDPRDVIMKIDGVEYKFKDHVKHTTNKRFVGYIAQQIESVVPEAVQLIDGILHVDYESLIPYLSDSIKQNFNDIKGLKTESEQIRSLLDSLYSEFLAKQTPSGKSKEKPTPPTRETASRIPKWQLLLAVGLFCFIGAAVGTFFLAALSPVDNNGTQGLLRPLNDTVVHHDREVLMKIFNDLNGPNWFSKNAWGTSAPHCDWLGISCTEQRVSRINMANNNLVGTIPDEIADLDQLDWLNLALNDLHGSIPTSILIMKSLSGLILHSNKNLTGTISSTVKNAENLAWLDLSGCNFYGTIPAQLMQHNRISLLNLSSNALTGAIPPTTNTNYIMRLDLSYNQLSDVIPFLRVTAELNLSHNKLMGDLANMKFTRLEVLDVSHNGLGGFFSMLEDSMDNLQYLDISHNKFFTANFPETFNFTVPECNASSNRFYCPIPNWLATRCSATCY